MEEKRNKRLETETYDCIAEMKALPDAFWLQVPSANRGMNFSSVRGDLPVRERYHYLEDDVLSSVEDQLHRTQPWAAEHRDVSHYKHKLGARHRYSKYPLYKIGENLYRVSTDCDINHTAGWSVESLQKSKWVNILIDWNSTAGRIWVKDRKKLMSLWNRLRANVRRKAGLLPPAEQKKNEKDVAITEAKMAVCMQVKNLQDELTAYLKSLNDNTVTKQQIGGIYFDLTELGKLNKTYKQVAGSRMSKK